MKPMTLRERVDSIAHDLSNDDALFSSVLDRYIEKKAVASTPAEVLRIAAQVEKETGLSKEAALHTAWETYVRYVNPDFLKEGGKVPPQFAKKNKDKGEKGEKGEDDKDEKKNKKGDEKSEKKDDKDEKGDKKDEKKDSDEKKENLPPWKTAAAIELAEKLGMTRKVCVMTKEAPKQKKMEPKTAAAKDLAKALGV